MPQLPQVFGRRADFAGMRAACAAGGWPVTLVGPPGVGKTLVARSFAATDFPDAWIVDARSAVSLESLERVLVLALSGGGGVDQARLALAEHPGRLLVLDNLEQCLAAARELLSSWAEPLSNVALVVTSRERLGTARERVVELLPLALPEAEASPDSLRNNPALALFTERAAAVGAPLREEDLAVAADIVRRLDGLPLAIELAAGRSGLLSPQALLKRLRKPLQVLRGPGRQPLVEAIEGSWELLSNEERTVLSACCIFPGHFDVEAAEAVAHSEAGEAALDRLQSLRDKSMLGRVGGSLLCVLVSVREFVVLRQPPSAAVIDAHAAWFLSRPRESAVSRGAYRDLQVALKGAVAGGQGSRAADAVLALQACWQVDPARQRAELGRVLERFEAELGEPTRVELLLARAALLDFLGEPGAMEDLDRAQAFAASEPQAAARVATQRSGVLRRRGDLGAAEDAARAALEAAPAHDGAARGEAGIGLGFALHAAGDAAGAFEAWSSAAGSLESCGSERRSLDALVYAAVAAQAAGQRELGQGSIVRGRRLAERLGESGALGFLLAIEARFSSRAGQHAAAEAGYEAALVHVSAAGDPFRKADVLLRWAGDRLDRGDSEGGRALIQQVRAIPGVTSSRKLQAELAAAKARLREPAAPATSVLRLDPERRRFRVQGEWVDLASRDLLWRLLERLAAGQEARSPLPMDELVASMWPDENLVGSSGRDRVYNAVSTLRRLGLAGVLRGSRAGYSLHAELLREE